MRSNLIGRETELHTLQEVLRTMKAGSGSRVAIIGEAGIGKSRLVTEAKKSMPEGITWVEGRALSYTRQHSYQPTMEILMKLMKASSNTEGQQLKVLLRKELEATLGAEGKNLLPFLGRMMQLPLEEEEEVSVKYLNADALRERIFTAFTTFLEARSRRGPLVTVWEDLHWADPSSLALIEHTLLLCDRCPLTVLLIFRPHKEEKIWKLHGDNLTNYGDRYQTVVLEPLSSEHSAHLVRNLIRIDNLSPEVEQLIFNKAEGNPFFVEELLRSLLDKGLLFLEGQLIRASAELDRLEIPGTLQGVIASRIDQLELPDKKILQTASILGRIFRGPVLSALIFKIKENLDLEHSLSRLIDRGLIRRREGDGETKEEYIFKHAVRNYARHSLKLAEMSGMSEYIGTACANLAWLAWKRGEFDEVETRANQAWAFWEKVPDVHSSLGFVWTAAWPLAAFYCQRGNLPGCIEQFKEMLQPGRKRLEPELEEEMKAVISRFEGGETGGIHGRIETVLELAEKYRYL